MAKGKLRYVILHGVALWGLLTATLVLLIRIVLGEEITAVSIALNYILCPLVGIFWGLSMWNYLTKRFQRMDQNRGA